MRSKRKNYFPTLLLILVLWGLVAGMVIYIEPELLKDVIVRGLYLPFWLIFFPASFLSLALILGNTRRGFLGSIGLTGFLILRLYGIGNFLNLLLILGIVIAMDRVKTS